MVTGLTGSAGVPIPDMGLRVPLGGTGILMSSGEPGIMSGARSGILMRLASFWYDAGIICIFELVIGIIRLGKAEKSRYTNFDDLVTWELQAGNIHSIASHQVAVKDPEDRLMCYN